MGDYIEEYRGLNSLLDRLIKTGDRHTDTHTDTQNLWNLEVLTHLKITQSFFGLSWPPHEIQWNHWNTSPLPPNRLHYFYTSFRHDFYRYVKIFSYLLIIALNDLIAGGNFYCFSCCLTFMNRMTKITKANKVESFV